jgi:hypothetical protein
LVTAANDLNNGTTYQSDDGLIAGDVLCQSRADAAQLEGTYRAWLSTSSDHAIERLGERGIAGVQKRAWYRTDGVKVGDIADIVNENLEAYVDADEYGNTAERRYTWTGTAGDSGTSYDYTTSYTCLDWTDATSSNLGTYGELDYTSYHWTYSDDGDCDGSEALYCFER